MSEYVSKQRIRYKIHFDKIKELVEAGNMWDWNDAIKVNDRQHRKVTWLY